MPTDRRNIRTLEEIGATESKRGIEIVAQNDWGDVGPQVAMHRNCHLF